MVEVNETSYANISLRSQREYEYQITERVYESFMDAFQDRSPIHVDQAYACEQGFDSRVMPGAILNGFLSHFIGVVYPGKQSLLLESKLSYARPLYLNDCVRAKGTVVQKMDGENLIVMKVLFEKAGNIVCRARVLVKLRG